MSVINTTRSASRIVTLAHVTCDERAFPRACVDMARVDEFVGLYRDELTGGNDPFPPIRCVEDRDGRLVLYDGWHRVAARRRIDREHPGRGYDELAAEIVRADGRDAVEYAYELAIDCSAIGSKQLTQSERIAAAKRLSEVRPDLPAREVARRLGISHPTVLRARGSAAVTGGGTRLPIANGVAQPAGETVAKTPKADRTVTLEQRAWRMADALRQLLDQSRAETRGMLGFGKPNLTRAGAAAYTALERSCGEDAPALAEDLFVLAAAMRDQAGKA